ncbi:putative L-gulonolactone/D-arabinono-1,4-lactone oxidase, FAD-binding domain, PCMH-type [Septoria linicola]|nr:putative L-gulonolactone/D-arabinono-1,4-lactone oxidase, FAD-binding domain, PCMH-type [Septoria linicola]
MTTQYAPENDVDSRIALLADALNKEPEFASKDVPGLINLLNDYLDPDVDVNGWDSGRIDFNRRLLRVFKDSPVDDTYQTLRDRYTDNEKSRLDRFLEGETADKCSHGFTKGPSLSTRTHLHRFLEGAKEFVGRLLDLDDDEQLMTIKKDLEFQNWGRTLSNNIPKYTVVPQTVADIQKVVRFAKQANLGVRCAGYRHSWSPIFGRTGEILISTLHIRTATEIPNFAALHLPEGDPNELESIELLPGPARAGGKRLVRIGCATTNERLRRWCVTHDKVTLPFNIIMVEITSGGSNGPICHGAGIKHQTLSDLVRKIEYVDANGELQSISDDDPEFLRAASGAFGLMGVVTHLTLEFDPMTYAELRPSKVPVIQAVPPPPGFPEDKIPLALRPKKPFSAEEKRFAQERFEKQANEDYYAEWFWFPYADECWVNCWNNTTDDSHIEDWPSPFAVFLSFVQEFTLNVLQYNQVLTEVVNKTGIAEAAVTLLSRFAMMNLPEVKEGEKPIKTHLINGLHFQRAIQNVRVRDLEVEMPLVPQKNDASKVDYTLVQQAWWDAILKCYEHSDTCPQRFPLEMRIMGGSNVIMAPQYGNALGTASIEILTLQNAVDIWQPYAQEVADIWLSYKDGDGKRLKTRPHWAKEWHEGYTIDGKPWLEKLKNEDYAAEIVEFKDILAKIGAKHGWTLADLKARFSNDLFDELIFDDIVVPEKAVNGWH